MPDNEYTGPEQRREQRRKNSDRRVEIRFELDNENRRKNKGRRSADGDIWDKREGD